MRLSIASITAIVALSAASPFAQPEADANTNALTLAERDCVAPFGSCSYCEQTAHYYTTFSVYLKGTCNNWLNNWGQGFLDNLRGECGDVENWGFNYENYDVSGTATFETTGDASCVEAAAWDASYQTLWGMECQDTGYC